MKKISDARVIEGEEVRRDDPIEYFLPTGSEALLKSQRKYCQLKSSKIKIFLEEGGMEGEKESVLLSVAEKRIGEA